MKTIVLLFFLLLCSFLPAQVSVPENGMQPKVYNFTSFSPPPSLKINDELLALTVPAFTNHPEFGAKPYNAPCSDCMELIDRRTSSSRYFVREGSRGNVFYVQQGYTDLHYIDQNHFMRSIDPRLRPHESLSGIYHAPDQPLPTLLNAATGSTSIKLPAFDLVFNNTPKLWHLNANTETQLFGSMNMSTTSVGNDGAMTLNAFPGINRSVVFDRGSIKTNFIITSVPSLTTNNGWLAFEDVVTLPLGFKIAKDVNGGHTPEGYWQGDLVLLQESDNSEMARWSSVVIYDESGARPDISNAAYQLKQNGNSFTIRTLVKVSWLNATGRVYPVTVDPLVSGSNTWTAGHIGFRAYAPGNGFCGSSSAFCLGGPLNVTFPGAATITNVLWSSTYEAISPAWKNDGGFRMVGPCGENPINTNNWWSCGSPPYAPGQCIGTNISVANLATCVPASCSSTILPFRVKDIDCFGWTGFCSITYLRHLNNTWIVTVQGQNLSTLSNTTTGNGTQTINAVCGSTVTMNPNPLYSVGPYTFSWNPGGQTTPTKTFSPVAPGNNTFLCTVTDACGVSRTATFVVTNTCTLPVELLEFYLHYTGGVCEIHWTTQTESNSDYFLLEKSSDGKIYSFLEKVTAAGNSSSDRKYHTLDPAPEKNGVTYYRLQLFDKGSATARYFSTQILDTQSDPAEKIQIQPNPASNQVDILLPGNLLNRNVTLEVLDYSGKQVHKSTVNRSAPKAPCRLSIDQLAPGVYSVHAFDESGNSSRALFIKN